MPTKNLLKNKSNTKINAKAKKKAWYETMDWSKFRLNFMAFGFLLFWFVLWARAGYLQLFEGSYLAERAKRQHTAIETVTGQRGLILDRNGLVLARNVETNSLYANPRRIVDKQKTAQVLARILGKSPADILKSINRNSAFVWLSRKLDDATAKEVRDADLTGIALVKEYERTYPFKQVAGQLLGFTNIDSKGLEGLEKAFNDDLAGISAKRTVKRDASGRRFHVNDSDMLSGEDLHLTIDVQIQFLAEEALANAVQAEDAKWGGALVVDVENGDILAWAQYPFFNPNAYSNYKAYQYRNRIALDALEPGSTLKPFVIASALEEGIVGTQTQFFCENGTWRHKSVTIRDDKRSYGNLTVEKILSNSSNIGTAKIGLTLGAESYHKYLTKLGFGQSTGLHVYESKGILHPARRWKEVDTMSISFGQGISVTALQLAQAYLTLGSGGEYKPLKLVKNVVSEEAENAGRVFSSKVSKEVIAMMQDVVEEGTGKRASIDGLLVAGKTGTAQKAHKDGGYGEERTASFAGFVPADNPKYLVVLVIDEPQKTSYGGVIGAPVFKNIVLKTLSYHGVPIEKELKENLKVENNKKQEELSKTEKDKLQADNKALSKNEENIEIPEFRSKIVSIVPKKNESKVPSVVGKSIRRAVEMFAVEGIVPSIKGEGTVVVKQSPKAGEKLLANNEYTLWLSE